MFRHVNRKAVADPLALTARRPKQRPLWLDQTRGKPPRCGAARGRRCLVRREIEFHLGAVRIVAEQLPGARAGLAAQHIVDLVLFQARRRAAEVAGAESHVVEYARGRVGHQLPGNDVQHRLIAYVEPGSGKIERRARSIGEAEEPDVERLGRSQVSRQHRKVIHCLNAHRRSLFRMIRAATIETCRAPVKSGRAALSARTGDLVVQPVRQTS